MQFVCRTDTISIELPKEKRIGVLVSGGIDSALLYYLLLKEKERINSDHIIFPVIMFRKEGSKYFARPIVEKINQLFGINMRAKKFGDNTLPEQKQIESAIVQSFEILQIDCVFVGVIHNRPEHCIGIEHIPVPNDNRIKTPLVKLEKDCIIQLFYDLGIEELLKYTHSCDKDEHVHCGTCNGCNERMWGFKSIGRVDPR